MKQPDEIIAEHMASSGWQDFDGTATEKMIYLRMRDAVIAAAAQNKPTFKAYMDESGVKLEMIRTGNELNDCYNYITILQNENKRYFEQIQNQAEIIKKLTK